ncbi:MAG: hypothetical protein ACRDHP_01790 [Ktedonobacterales bacterium]
MSPLTAWENFYVIAGSSAGALTGLTFVVITLVAQTQQREADRGIAAFTTPVIVHFGAVLLICALLSMPWPAFPPLAILLGLGGVAGVLYSANVVRIQRRLEEYAMEMEDWVWYGVCPLVAFATLLVAAILLPGSPVPALFAIAGAILLLLFLGIHNAWDVVTYLVVERILRQNGQDETKES